MPDIVSEKEAERGVLQWLEHVVSEAVRTPLTSSAFSWFLFRLWCSTHTRRDGSFDTSHRKDTRDAL